MHLGRSPAILLHAPFIPKVGPKLGEQRRTQATTSASSGDLQPPLGEETAPPLVQDQCAAFLCSWQCYTVLVNVETESLVFPQWIWRPCPPPSASLPQMHCPGSLAQHQQRLAPQCLALPQQFLHHLRNLLYNALDGYYPPVPSAQTGSLLTGWCI